MELNDLKNSWENYDRKLKQNLRVDEEKLRVANLDKSKDEMEYPYISELVELIGGFLVTSFIIVLSLRVSDKPEYSLPALLTIIIGIIYMGFSFQKFKLLKRVNYFSSPIVKLQHELAFIKMRILKFRKIEMLLFPLYILPLTPLTSKALFGIDIYSNIPLFAVKAITTLGIAYFIIFLIHKHLYDKRFKKVEGFIKRLKEFEKE